MIKVMTVIELANYLKLDPKTIREYARKKRIPARKVGSQWRFLKSSIDQWLSGEYAIREQKPTGVVKASEGNACRYSKEVKPTGLISGMVDAEYENLLGQ